MRELGKKQLALHLHERLENIPKELAEYGLELGGDGLELTYTYDTQRSSTGITALLGALHEAGIHFNDLYSSQSSLEDIFVDLVSTKR